MNQPGGACCFRFFFTRIFPSATTLVAKSSTMAGPSLPGMPMAWGLVPRRRAAPPHGATLSPCTALTHSMPTSPWCAAISVLRDTDDAMRVVPAQVGQHEQSSNPGSIARRRAEPLEDAGRRALETAGVYGWHVRYNT